MATVAASLQVNVGADISGALSGLGKATKGISGFGADVAKSALGFGLAQVGMDSLSAAWDTLKKASGVGLARDLEDVMAQFEAMLGSGAQAEQMIAGIRRRADETPFGFLELAQASASLIPIFKRTGAPMEEMLNTALKLASFDPAQGLAGATFALREFAAGDFISLKRRFEIDTDPIEKLIAKGVPGLKALNTVLEQNGVTMDLVDKRAKTTGGRLNTFADLLGSIAIEAGKPILGAFGVELDRMSGIVTGNLPALKDFARTMGTNIAGGIRTAGESLGIILQTATNIAGAHGLGLIDSALIATELRLKEVFGEGAAGAFHGLVEAIRGIPTLIANVSDFLAVKFPAAVKTIETVAAGLETTFKDIFAGIQRDFGLFVIGLADIPGLGGAFDDAAAHFRTVLGMGDFTGNRPALTGGVPTGLPANLPVATLADRGGPTAIDESVNITVQRVDASDPADLQRFAATVAQARRRTSNAAPPSAPGG